MSARRLTSSKVLCSQQAAECKIEASENWKERCAGYLQKQRDYVTANSARGAPVTTVAEAVNSKPDFNRKNGAKPAPRMTARIQI